LSLQQTIRDSQLQLLSLGLSIDKANPQLYLVMYEQAEIGQQRVRQLLASKCPVIGEQNM
jgi:hypothetical protein